jgi:hypothetical protein
MCAVKCMWEENKMYACILLKFDLEMCHFSWAPTHPLQPGTIVVFAMVLSPTCKQAKENWSHILNLLPLYLSTRSSSLGTISCCEILAYFKYTPVKTKINIITNTNFCVVICNLDHTGMLKNITVSVLLICCQTDSVAQVCERPPLVSGVGANSCQIEGVAWSAQWTPMAVFSAF